MTFFIQSRQGWLRALAVVLCYGMLVTIIAYAHWNILNADGIAYLRLAEYIAGGHWERAVTGDWSPLLSFIISFFMRHGWEGVAAVRVIFIAGGFLLLLAAALLASRFKLSGDMTFIVMLIAAAQIAVSAPSPITPDTLSTTFLVLYFYFVTRPDLLTRRAPAFFCGILAGLAYLAKYYAFPFFMVHFPLALCLRNVLSPESMRKTWMRIAVSWLIGIMGFFLVTSFWIMLVSKKFDRLTFGTVGTSIHATLGPMDIDRRDPFRKGLHRPKEYAITVWEDPTGEMGGEYAKIAWSPFHSVKYFTHQIYISWRNSVFMFWNPGFDLLKISLASLLLCPFAYRLSRDRERKFLYGWIFLTVAIYSGGYILTWGCAPRYHLPTYLILLFLSFLFLDVFRRRFSIKRPVIAVFIISFLGVSNHYSPSSIVLGSLKTTKTARLNPSRALAERLEKDKMPGPFATIGFHTGEFIAYYAKKQFVGTPAATDAEGIARELEAVGAKSIVVFEHQEIAAEEIAARLKNDPRYHLAADIDNGRIQGFNGRISVFLLKNDPIFEKHR